MALTADKVRATRSQTNNRQETREATNAVTFYAGGLVGEDNSTGRMVKWSDTVNLKFLGVLNKGVVGDTAASPIPRGEVNVSGVTLEKVSVTGVTAIADVGDLVYATDDDTLTKTATINVLAIGRIVEFHSGTTVDVHLFTPDEYRAFTGI